jgi:uncharacterized protein (TIGR02145 family)
MNFYNLRDMQIKKAKRYYSFFTISIVFILTISCKKDDINNIITDIDGNVYTSVKIGTQEWMVENLKTTRYNDGSAIPLVTSDTAWSNLKTPGYCWYNNDAPAYKNTYGALYNWYTVNTGRLCPKGWHVPSNDEWKILTTFLGGGDIAGGKLKEAGFTHWRSPNSAATNEMGFTALPGGCRYGNGSFYMRGLYGFWWTTSEDISGGAFTRGMDDDETDVSKHTGVKGVGASVRCVRDL